MRLVRELSRRKLRTTLTISGITIGIWALVVSARAAEVLALLRTFNRERGQTVLLVTHDAEVGATCDRIIRMRDGVIVADERVPGRATLEADSLRPIASSTPGAAIPVPVA